MLLFNHKSNLTLVRIKRKGTVVSSVLCRSVWHAKLIRLLIFAITSHISRQCDYYLSKRIIPTRENRSRPSGDHLTNTKSMLTWKWQIGNQVTRQTRGNLCTRSLILAGAETWNDNYARHYLWTIALWVLLSCRRWVINKVQTESSLEFNCKSWINCSNYSTWQSDFL